MMCSRWVRELEMAVMSDVGKILRHPQGERSPAAAELEDAVAVVEIGALAGEFEACGFRILRYR